MAKEQTAKYRLLKSTAMTLADGTVVYRIEATRLIKRKRDHHIQKGTLGGWVSGPDILARTGGCWIHGNGIVVGNSVIQDEACVESGYVRDTEMSGLAKVDLVCEDPMDEPRWIVDRCCMHDESYIDGRVKATEVSIHDQASIDGRSEVYECKLWGRSSISGSGLGAEVKWVDLGVAVEIVGSARVFGKAGRIDDGDHNYIKGWCKIGNRALVTCQEDILTIGSIGSDGGVLTVYRTDKRNELGYTRGCFTGDEKAFREAIRKRHLRNKHATRYRQLIDYANSHFGIRPKQVAKPK